MCDTLCKLIVGENFFAKNSDRDEGEPQFIFFADSSNKNFDEIPEFKSQYQNESLPLINKLKATLPNNIPALLSRPSWIWGAEIGINKHGVTIGNEAVFSNKITTRKGILGMDFLRLALHNSSSAYEALQLLIQWIQVYPQGGNGSYSGKLYYDNSFIIRDKKEAYILETVGKHYNFKKVNKYAAISNAYSINNADSTNCNTLNIKQKYESKLFTYFTQGNYRKSFNQKFLEKSIDTQKIMLQMQSHGDSNNIHKSMKGVCLHAKGIASTTTTASWIVDYNLAIPVIWYMPHAHPCVGIYQPIPLSLNELSNYSDIKIQMNNHLIENIDAKNRVANYPKFLKEEKEKYTTIQNELIEKIIHENNSVINL
jgi:secernin